VSGEKIREFDVAYFAASCDDAETNKKFAESLELDYAILSDPERETATDYGLISGNKKNTGRVTVYIGKDGKILHMETSVKAGSHGEQIAATLAELGVDKK